MKHQNKPGSEVDVAGPDYAGLYGEVVTCDIYRLRQLKFIPDTIFDIGANIGIFTRHARSLFPKALIVAVEPDPKNCSFFRQLTPEMKRVVLLEAALGGGSVFHGTTARNGSGETYLSGGLGYPVHDMWKVVKDGAGLEFVSTVSRPLWDITYSFLKRKQAGRLVMKIDCEGAENCIWQDVRSMEILRQMDYICMEIHMYALKAEYSAEVREVTLAALGSLEKTHDCELQGVNFWATKKI